MSNGNVRSDKWPTELEYAAQHPYLTLGYSGVALLAGLTFAVSFPGAIIASVAGASPSLCLNFLIARFSAEAVATVMLPLTPSRKPGVLGAQKILNGASKVLLGGLALALPHLHWLFLMAPQIPLIASNLIPILYLATGGFTLLDGAVGLATGKSIFSHCASAGETLFDGCRNAFKSSKEGNQVPPSNKLSRKQQFLA